MPGPIAPLPADSTTPSSDFGQVFGPDGGPDGFLRSNRNFPNFIGFISNPVQSIDPRSLTQFWPVFGSNWVSAFPPLASGNMQVYGAGLNLALTDRLSVGANQGGYATSHFDRQRVLFRDKLGDTKSTSRDGWLNLGGFAQYTLIEDVPNQFLLTVGLRVEAPTGESEVFQGHGPAYLSPYFTIGKEFGHFHVLATAGYEFPAGSGESTSNTFYGCLHLDYQVCSWLYPVVEFNGAVHTRNVSRDLETRRGFFNASNFDSTGNILTVAPGFNLVLVPQRVEFGAVYATPITAPSGLDFDGLFLKMVFRY